MILCGHCMKYHASIGDVRLCSQNVVTVGSYRRDGLPTVQDWQELHRAMALITEGFYETPEGVIYKVQRAVHGSGHLYAKRLFIVEGPEDSVMGLDGQQKLVSEKHGEFRMERGAIRRLRPEWKLNRERAQALGKLYGFCIRCGATLTDETSIAQGMGPVCAGRWS